VSILPSSPWPGQPQSPNRRLLPHPPVIHRRIQVFYETADGLDRCCVLRIPTLHSDSADLLINRAITLFRQKYGVDPRVVSVVLYPRLGT
jgi:hypothetical protein